MDIAAETAVELDKVVERHIEYMDFIDELVFLIGKRLGVHMHEV